jgi:hypothetical protein
MRSQAEYPSFAEYLSGETLKLQKRECSKKHSLTSILINNNFENCKDFNISMELYDSKRVKALKKSYI